MKTLMTTTAAFLIAGAGFAAAQTASGVESADDATGRVQVVGETSGNQSAVTAMENDGSENPTLIVYDADADDRISYTEYRTYYTERPIILTEEPGEIAAYDANTDGMLDDDEYEAVFLDYDRDADGYLNAEEQGLFDAEVATRSGREVSQ